MAAHFRYFFLIGFFIFSCGNRFNAPVVVFDKITGLNSNELEVELHNYFINSKLSEKIISEGIIYNVWINNSGFIKYEVMGYDAISKNVNSEFTKLNELYYPFNDSLVFAITSTPSEMFTKYKINYYVFNLTKEMIFLEEDDTFKLLNDSKKYKQLFQRYRVISEATPICP